MAELSFTAIEADTDSLAKLVQEYFAQAKEYKLEDQLKWQDANDTFNAQHRTHLEAADTPSQGVFIHLVRRRVNTARVRLSSLLFESGKVPFSITPNRKPKVVSPELLQMQDPAQVEEEVKRRSENMESHIRDLLRKSDYVNVINDTITEMCLYGTGVTKSVVLKKHNYPVYQSAKMDPNLAKAEDMLESEYLPTVERVSIWDIFPVPEAKSKDDCEWIIQRAFYSIQTLRDLATQPGFMREAIEEVIETGDGEEDGSDQSEAPFRYTKRRAERFKKFQVLEMWGEIPVEELEPYMDIPEGIHANLSVCVTVCGDKVIRVVMNPFDGRIPYDFCYWESNPDSIWGDGIYFTIQDLQEITNFAFAQMVEGKLLASNPMSVIDPQSFDEGEDLENVRPGKIIKVRPGNDVNAAFRPVIIPDVTSGLDNLINMVERQADVASGQSAIGMGESSAYQTKTATGMSILQSNSNKLTAEVVRSVSDMISHNIEAIYYWVMADSQDSTLKGDYDCASTGFMNYVAKEVHNAQLLNLMGVLAQNPDMREGVNMNSLLAPLFRAFSIEPEGIVLTAKEMEEKQKQALQQQQEAVEMERQIAKEAMVAKSLLDEKMAVSFDERKAQLLERELLIKNGNVMQNPADFKGLSILLQEENEREMMQQMQQQMKSDAEEEDLANIEEDMNNEEIQDASAQEGLNSPAIGRS